MELNSGEDEPPLTPTTYKKRYSSSWFYGQTDTSFPTIEEQVELCRKIASQLVNDENKESKGASMFYKRVKRAPKWVHQSTRIIGSGLSGSTNTLNTLVDDKLSSSGDQGCLSEDEREQIEKMRQRFRDETRKPLKLILDPRELKSVERLRKSGTSFSEHNVISPDVCHNLVKELNSPDINKGAQIFLKRKEKSTQWVVEENQATKEVREIKERQEKLEAMANASELSSRPESRLSNYNQSSVKQDQPSSKLPDPMSLQRIRLVKSPWEAALTTGNVENAFVTVTPSRVVKTVKEAAAIKQQSSFDNPTNPLILTNETMSINNSSTITTSIAEPIVKVTNNSIGSNVYNQSNYNKDLYLARAPRGWNTNEPRRDDGHQMHRPTSTASFYQQHYYQPGSYSPLTVGASLPESSRNSSRLGHYDQSSISEPTINLIHTANQMSTSSNLNRFSSHSNLYNNYNNSQKPVGHINQPSNIEMPHFDLLSLTSSKHSLPKYRDFNGSPRGFIRPVG